MPKAAQIGDRRHVAAGLVIDGFLNVIVDVAHGGAQLRVGVINQGFEASELVAQFSRADRRIGLRQIWIGWHIEWF